MKAGWQIIPMGQLCSIKSGKSDTKDATEDGAYSFFDRSRTIKKSSRYLFDCEALIIPGEGTEFLPKYFNGKFDLHQRAYALFDFSKQIDVKFLYHYLHYKCDYFPQVAVGATVKSLRLRHFEQLPVAITNITEQQRIVSILDEAFAGIATATANAEKNLANARELFASYLQSILTNKGEGWETKKLGEVAEYFNGLTYSPKDVCDKGIIVLRSSNVQNDELDFRDIVRVNLTVKDKILVQDGDILMCSRNGSKRLVGKTATIKNLGEVMTFGTFMMIVRSQNNPYLAWFFKSLDFRKQISGGENTMINQITRYMLDDVSLAFPAAEKQSEIVQKLDELSTETKKLEAIYQQKLNALEELKKSILNQAFSGQLQ
jgi:type I restriction enzyme S subunit